MRILAVNVGSTSLRLRVVGEYDRVEGTADLPPPSDLRRGALGEALARMGSVDAVGHRVVHGGTAFTEPVLLGEQVISELRALADLAPLHQPPALDAVDAVAAAIPDVPAVACFDTAFHATLPPAASTYAIPQRWRELGVRRYGFHGLSHAWTSRRAIERSGLPVGQARVVTCHLGGGASLAAVAGGRCVDTTMGFTPLEGLVMATRSGSVDPGLVLWLQERHGMSAHDVADELEHRSGLVGLCGTDDMREVSARAAAGDPLAAQALDVYVHRLRGGIAAMTAALGGLDVLVFSGGVGEHSAPIRAATCAGLGFLGAAVDDDLNRDAVGDQQISAPGAAVLVLVVEAREDLEIAAGVRHVLR
jgi:acetate kinase